MPVVSLPPRGLLLTLTGVTCEERNHLKCHDKYFTAAAAAERAAAEVVFLAANIGGTLLCGKEPLTRRERREKDTHGSDCSAKRERGEAADMRVVQCLIHASAVSDSGSAAPFSSSSFEVMAKLRAESGGRASVSAAVCGVGMNLALNYSHFL